jgi:hypothetical protein
MAGIYNIDWSNVGRNLLFWRWRRDKNGNRAKLMANLDSIMASVQVTSNKLNTLDDETDDFLQYTGQHKVLEEFLNNKYDIVQRRIFITENDIAGLDPVVMGISGETVSQPVVMGLSGETVAVPVSMAVSLEALQDNNFTVNIPNAVTYDEPTLRAQLDNYVLAGKQYNIVTF